MKAGIENKMDFSNAVTSTPNTHLLPIGAERIGNKVSAHNSTEHVDLKTDLSLYLEFEIKGEQMVSKLCDSTDSAEEESNAQDVKSIVDVNLISSDIKKLALEACEAAEKISKNSTSRCFNGMHYLCSKARENIERSDSAVTKLQSQGLPWVIKTFILSLLKIVDGWKCLSDVLDEQSNDSDRLKRTFHEWESVTKVMLCKIHTTYENLNEGLKGKQQVNSISVQKQMSESSETHNLMADKSLYNQMGNIQCQCVASESEIVKYCDSTRLQEDLGKIKMLNSETQLNPGSRIPNAKVLKKLPIKPNRKSKKKNSNNYQKMHQKK